MKVTIETFALAREKLGFSRNEIEMPMGSIVSDVAEVLSAEHPGAVEVLERSRWAMNGEYVGRDAFLDDGAVLSIIPPVSGGVARVVISADPIDVNFACSQVQSLGAGAIVTFAGTVRNTNDGVAVVAITYEAKIEMAIREIERLIDQADVIGAFVQHRIGRVEAGEISVVIAVSCAHREQAYKANAWLLDELKKVAPIWKHEERINGTIWLGQGGG